MAKKSATALVEKAVEPEVLMPEESIAVTDGGKITSFVRNAAAFFAMARTLETEARDRLQRARAFAMPKDAQQDVDLQLFIRECSAGKKAVVEHWEITSIIHGLHKRLVAARKRGEDGNEEAAGIAQRMHNQYVEQEQRRAREEEDRRRREAQAAADAERARELAALEQQAIDAEAGSADLSDREARFVALVCQGLGARAAAENAGFKDAVKSGERLMAAAKIQAAIEAKRAAVSMRQQAEAVKQRPVAIQDVKVQPNIAHVGSDRTTWGAEIYDGAALRAAAIEDEMLHRAGQPRKYGIPREVLMVNPVQVNEHARSLHELIDAWPGCRHTKKTRTV